MKQTIQLWDKTPGMCEEIPVLDLYIPEKQTSDIAVVILPGGGYGGRAPHEGEGYAEFLNSHGIAAFVCQYRVAPHRFPLPLLDSRRAVRYVRYHSEKFGLSHLGSGQNLLGDRHAELGEELSPDLIADETTPKAFIWHTFNDDCVNVINSLDYAKRLRQVQVPVELHIYPDGPHGLGLAPAYPHVADWSEQLIRWLIFNDK